MARLDQDREKKLQPKRVESCLSKLREIDHIEVTDITETTIRFNFNGNTITFYPYSGWHTGKGIKDGRGFKKLLRQIEN